MKQDFARIVKLYRVVSRLLPGFFLTGTAVSSRNLFITLLNSYLGANVVAQCAEGQFSGLGQTLIRFAGFLVLFLLFDALAAFGYAQSLEKIRYAIRTRIYSNILHAPLSAVDAVGQRGELLSRMNQDVEVAMGSFQSPMLPMMFLISGIGATIGIVRIHPVFILILYALGFVLAFSKSRISRSLREHMKTMQKSQAAILSGVLHTHTWLRELRASRLNGFQEKLIGRSFAAFRSVTKRLARTEGTLGLLTGVETTAGSLLILGLGVWFHRLDLVTLADLVYLFTLSPLVLMMFSSFSDILVSLRMNLAGLDRIWDLLYMEDEYARDAQLGELTVRSDPLTVEALSCVFGNGKTAFSGLSFTIPPAGLIAVCGPSGSGKTTLARMMLKLYPASGGTLRLYGQDIETLSCASVRRSITYVTQENALPMVSIRENLKVGPNCDEGQMLAILQAVCAETWINALPEKLDSGVPELSGGQRQAIAIARALMRNTPAYILDEAFAGIDQGRIAAILQRLKASYPERLFLIITHDPSVVALCDGRIDIASSV